MVDSPPDGQAITAARSGSPATGSTRSPLPETIAADRPESDPTETREIARLATAAFERLRPEQKRVLQLAIQYGCSHEQIATTTGLPLGTVKTHARRGLIKLRALLADEGVEIPEPMARAGKGVPAAEG